MLMEGPEGTFEEFERRLLGNPNSSLLWIKYMSAALKLVDIAKARGVAERALQTINFRQEQEKLNIWLAYLNMENLYGTAETLKQVFDRSLIYCEPRTMYMQLARMYAAAGKREPALVAYETLTKKWAGSAKVWLAYGEYLYEGDLGGARRLLTTALRALPKRKHAKVTMKWAQLEYRQGSPERARTLFEGILANTPKRLDIWSVYVTMEGNRLGPVEQKTPAKGGGETSAPSPSERGPMRDYVRRLYERILAMRLSSKKAKFFFKRYLEFEKRHGSEAGIAHVKDLVRRYVEGSGETPKQQ